jgi:hypothetical protein
MTRILFLVGAGVVVSHNFDIGSWAYQVSGHFPPGESDWSIKEIAHLHPSAEAQMQLYLMLYLISNNIIL